MSLTEFMAKQQGGARNHAMKATHELIEGSDNAMARSATAKLNRKDHNECECLQM
jgi:hypothetical protein